MNGTGSYLGTVQVPPLPGHITIEPIINDTFKNVKM